MKPEITGAVAAAVQRDRDRVAALRAEIDRLRETLTAEVLAAVNAVEMAPPPSPPPPAEVAARPPTGRTGPGSAQALLSPDDERAALEALARCEHIAVVAARYGITQDQLRKLRQNRLSKHRREGSRPCLQCGTPFVPTDWRRDWFCQSHKPDHEPIPTMGHQVRHDA